MIDFFSHRLNCVFKILSKIVIFIRLVAIRFSIAALSFIIASTVNAQENTSTDILTMGNSLTAGLAGNQFGVIRCAALGNIIIAASNQRSCRGNGQQNVGGWQPILRSLTGSNTFNFGNSGETTAEMVNRFQRDLAARPSKYVLILGGTNDVIINRPRSETITNIQRMITATRTANRIPIVGTIPPLLFGRFASINSRVIELNAAINALTDVEVVDHYAVLVTNWGAHNSGDTIHLGSSGNQIVAQGWADAIERLRQPPEPERPPVAVAPVLNLLIK